MSFDMNWCKSCADYTGHENYRCIRCREREDAEELEHWKEQSVEYKLLDLHERLLKLEKKEWKVI